MPELVKMIKESYELYPRIPFSTIAVSIFRYVSMQAKPDIFSNRKSKMVRIRKRGKREFFKYIIKDYYERQTIHDRENFIEYRMRTSRRFLDEVYLKIFSVEVLD